MADSSLSAKLASPRELKRAKSAALSTGAGTASSMAAPSYHFLYDLRGNGLGQVGLNAYRESFRLSLWIGIGRKK
jgi:hypothetical protein